MKSGRYSHTRLDDSARASLVFWSRLFDWKDALVIVKPETLIGWHRKGFKPFWKWKSRVGRPRLAEDMRKLIERLRFGYEDVEICWRAWLRRWKTLYVPDAICWHRVGSSVQSRDAERFAFRGVLKGRLLFSTKLLPARYAVRTWMVSTAGLAKDVSRLKWKFATDRMRVLVEMAGLIPQLLRERRVLFRRVGRSPEEQLDFQLRQTANIVKAGHRR
jgi:GT2 family glycosyltransferase